MKELVDQLVSTVRVDERQARGGAGVLLKAARDKLGPQEFTAMLGGLPGLEDLIRQAPQPGGLGKLFGGLASTVGGGHGALVASIVSGFGSLGLGTDHARRMAPVIMEFVRAKVGAETADKLEKALRAGS
jgi:uncharacterized protein YidB (DUF937 family)